MNNQLTLILILVCIVLHQGFSQSRPNATKATLNHTAIYVVNVKVSTAFYQTILGLDTLPEPFHDGRHAWLNMAPQVALHIIEGATTPKVYYKNQHTCFSIQDLSIFMDLLKKNTIPWEDVNGVKQAITTRVDGVHQLWLQDPDGYWIEVNDAQ